MQVYTPWSSRFFVSICPRGRRLLLTCSLLLRGKLPRCFFSSNMRLFGRASSAPLVFSACGRDAMFRRLLAVLIIIKVCIFAILRRYGETICLRAVFSARTTLSHRSIMLSQFIGRMAPDRCNTHVSLSRTAGRRPWRVPVGRQSSRNGVGLKVGAAQGGDGHHIHLRRCRRTLTVGIRVCVMLPRRSSGNERAAFWERGRSRREHPFSAPIASFHLRNPPRRCCRRNWGW